MNSSEPEIIHREVAALIERKRTAQAKARLSEALRQYPDHPDFLVQSALTDYLEDNPAAAVATLHRVLALDPDRADARQLLFELEMNAGRSAEAEQLILALLKDYPAHAPFYGRYAELLIRTLLVAKARSVAAEGLRYDANDMECLAAMTICDVIEAKGAAASEALQALLRHHPQSQRTLMLVVAALEGKGDHHDALRIAQELVRSDPASKEFVDVVVALRAATHWSAIPLWPMRQWGYAASIAIWLGAVLSIRTLAKVQPEAALSVAAVFIVYVVYSWVWPPILKRLLARG